MRHLWTIILMDTDVRLLAVVILRLCSEDPVLLWIVLRTLIDGGYRGPCEISVGAALSFDIQFEHRVHRPLVIVEEGVFLWPLTVVDTPFTTRGGMIGRPLCVASPLLGARGSDMLFGNPDCVHIVARCSCTYH